MMKRHIAVILFFCLFALHPSTVRADFVGYTSERPLVIVSDWDFRPYEFIDENGQPSGYNIEVLRLIFDRLGIPYQFKMKEWHDATRDFELRKADLIHAAILNYRTRPYVATQRYVNSYTLCAVRKATTPPMINVLQLDQHKVVALKQDDYATKAFEVMDTILFKRVYCSVKDGLAGVSAGKYSYYIWGMEPLKAKVKELALDSLVFDEANLPSGELHVVGYDKDIIDMIDEEYYRLEQAGVLVPIYDKWFNPEKPHDETSPVVLMVIGAFAVVLIVLALMAWLVYMRVKVAIRRNVDLNGMMTHALSMGEYYVLQYDIQEGIVRNIYANLLPDEGMAYEEFIRRLPEDEISDFREHITFMECGELEEWVLRNHWNIQGTDQPVWNEYYGSAILERENGAPRYIFFTVRDVTREVEEEKHNQEMADIYMKIFETNIVPMSFYGVDGKPIAYNQKMRELCNITPETEPFIQQGNIFNDEAFKSFSEQNSRETYRVCNRMRYSELDFDKYIELHVKPIFDEKGERQAYYIVTLRDITSEREIYIKQREHDRRLQKYNEDIKQYEEQLQYLLEESNMYVWKLDIAKQRITLSRSLRETMFEETVEQHLANIVEHERDKARRIFADAVMQGKPFQVVHQFTTTFVTNGPTWYSISGVPLRDSNGKVTQYFGLLRDVTNLMLAQQRLREETARAEDSGRLKAAFLANMTHEIRTPLNAIVGFSDVLQMVEDPAERLELIRIIRNNSDMLLRLINDILEASSMGQALLIQPTEIDLPNVFEDICMTLEQRVQEVPFLRDNPCETYSAYLDKGRLQQLLTNFTTNAVKYTHEGHIKVGWRPENRGEVEGLYFYCEDTGAGIPVDKLSSVFDRFVKLNEFVQGTGLGLSICKAIVEKCGGEIGVTSEGEGHGCTFWFWVPRRINVSE